jgi:hypothetical protein
MPRRKPVRKVGLFRSLRPEQAAALRALVLRFHRASDGYCAPSYTVLQAATGLCRQSIARALQRLEAAGILVICRRLIREVIDGVMVCRQGSNLYSVSEPAEHAEKIPVRAPAGRPFPRSSFAELARLLGWEPSLPSRRKPTFGFQIGAAAAETPIGAAHVRGVCG